MIQVAMQHASDTLRMPQYSLLLMQHFQTPHNAGALEQYDGLGEASLAGRAPRIKIYLALQNGLISRAGFETFGCGVAIACASASTEMALGLTPQACLSITALELVDLFGGLPQGKRFCANLAVEALQLAAQDCLLKP